MEAHAYIEAHQSEWDRLRALTRTRRLSPEEADEFYDLYQTAAAQLSTLRSQGADPLVLQNLSMTLYKARASFQQRRRPSLGVVSTLFVRDIPAALYRKRWWIWAVTGLMLIVSVVQGIWLANQPDELARLATFVDLDTYAHHDFVNYYREHSHQLFAAMVWTNNAWIAVQCIAGGITGIFPLYVLWGNMVSVGQAGAMMHSQGVLDVFFSFILPHGMLELQMVMVAGAAGIALFWAMVRPGPVPMRVSLAREGTQTLLICIALVIFLALSGLVEGFVTPSYLPVAVKLAIGGCAFASFWLYTLVLGKRAAGDTVPVYSNVMRWAA